MESNIVESHEGITLSWHFETDGINDWWVCEIRHPKGGPIAAIKLDVYSFLYRFFDTLQTSAVYMLRHQGQPPNLIDTSHPLSPEDATRAIEEWERLIHPDEGEGKDAD